MWTRAGLKNYAKDFLRKSYLHAFIVCLIFSIVTGGRNNNDNNINNEYNNSPPSIEQQFEFDDDIINEVSSSGVRQAVNFFGLYPLLFMGSSLFAFVALIWVVIFMFIKPLITVGKNRFFLNGFNGNVDVKYLFSTFNTSEFWGIFKCMVITNIKNFLWYLLFIIPGAIKYYEYSMVPYILTKNTGLTSWEAIQISRDLTNGHKWNMFVLDLSFIGWYLLGGLLFGIGTFFVTPYHEATKARLYNVLSGSNQDINGKDVV